MHLILIRHGIAAPREETADDESRALTPRGAEKIVRHARVLARCGATPTELWTSPLVRARQTAEMLNRVWAVPLHVSAALAPDGDFETLRAALCERDADAVIALVGHEPMMGEIATYVVSGVRASAVRFKKGGAARIEVHQLVPRLRGELLWLLTPRQMAFMDQ